MGAIAYQINSLVIVYSTVYSDTDQRKHQSSPSLPFVREIHRGPVNSPHKWPVMRKIISTHRAPGNQQPSFPSDMTVMPQSHPTTGPVRFFSPIRFLARKAKWSARRNFTSVLFSWSHQATGPIRLDTAVRLWFGRIIRRTPRDARTGPVREYSMFFISYGIHTGTYGTRKVAAWHPYGQVRELTQPELAKYPHGRRIWPYGARTAPYGPARAVPGLITIAKPVRGP